MHTCASVYNYIENFLFTFLSNICTVNLLPTIPYLATQGTLSDPYVGSLIFPQIACWGVGEINS